MQIAKKTIRSIPYEDRTLVVTRNIRVLLVLNQLCTGGATNVVLDVANHFNKHPDFDVHLLVGPVSPSRNDVAYLAHERGISTQVIPSLVNRVRPLANARAIADIRRIIVQGNYDIVHTHTSVAGIVGRMAAQAARARVIIHHVHGWGLQEDMSASMRMLYVGLERVCAGFADRIIAVSKPDIQKGIELGIAKEDKFALIFNGIELDKFRQPVDEQRLRSELGLEPDSKLVGMIGRLDEQKNPLDFIRAAAEVIKSYSKVQFLIVGGGSLRPECEQLISELNLEDKIFLLGFRNDVNKLLPMLTITAMSSLWEGLPIAFMESMSAGKPIVANNVDGASDVVIDGETGFLVTPRQPAEMAMRILQLLNNEELCNKMGQVAQHRSSFYSTPRMVRQVESLYKELLRESKAPLLRPGRPYSSNPL